MLEINVAEFLFASGFALLIVLVGWSTQITTRSKETKELESEFLKKAKLADEEYKKIINKAGSPKDSLFALVDFIYSQKDSKGKNAEILEKIKYTKEYMRKLETKYRWRFWVLLTMTLYLLIGGAITLFLKEECKIWALSPSVIFVALLFINLINVHNLEKKYTDNISKIMEEL